MIFAAGLGTRLRPLTNDRPKALVPVNGLPLLEIAIRRLRRAGLRELIVNVHHFAHQIVDFLARNDHFGLAITISDEREQLLDTGGGLRKAAWFFEDGAPFLLVNADVITDLDFKAFYEYHRRKGGLATLAVRQRVSSRYLLFDESLRLCGWRNEKTGETKTARPAATTLTPWGFSGLQVIDPALFARFPDQPVFSIIDLYLDAARDDAIFAYPHDDSIWIDVGKPEALARAGDLLPRIALD